MDTKKVQAYTHIQQAYINGKVIEDDSVRVIYDGNKLIVDLYDNGKHMHKQLNKKDIKSILAKRAHPLSLEKRLINDFGLVGKRSIKKKSIRIKSNKRKKTIKRKKY